MTLMAVPAHVPETTDAPQLVHLRVPASVHRALKTQALDQGRSLQSVAVNALQASLDESILDPAVGLLRVYPSRFVPELEDDLAASFGRADHADLLGITLLDFLSDEGWARAAFQNTLPRLADKTRLLIENRNSPVTAFKIGTALGFDPNDESSLKASAKYLELEHAERLIGALRERHPRLRAGRYAGYPVVRWLAANDDALFVEPHCYRAHVGRTISPAHLPVFVFHARSEAADRYREHVESIWNAADKL
jgi:hypothetical protein